MFNPLSQIPLHTFDLTEKIGAGGMGSIYRATHRPSGANVALKIVQGEADEQSLERFEREVRAHAALLHPSIVQLMDYGVVNKEAAQASKGLILDGAPYVAMELADHGTLSNIPVNDWARAVPAKPSELLQTPWARHRRTEALGSPS